MSLRRAYRVDGCENLCIETEQNALSVNVATQIRVFHVTATSLH